MAAERGGSSGPRERDVTADVTGVVPIGVLTGAPGLGTVALALVVYLVAQTVLGLAVLLLGRWLAGPFDPASMPIEWFLASAAVGLAGGLVLVVMLLRRRGVDLAAAVGPVRPLGRPVLIGTAIGGGALLVSGVLIDALMRLTGREGEPEQVLLSGVGEGPLATVLVVVVAVVLAPLAEELLFRGLLFRSLRRRLGLAASALVSAGVFAVVHTEVVISQPLALVGLLLLGAVFAVAYERTGTLVVPVVGHAVFNGLTLVAVAVSAGGPFAGAIG